MKRFIAAFLFSMCFLAYAEEVEKTVVTVDQNGQLNVDSVASVTAVATNAVLAQIAQAKADAASATAQNVTNALNGIVQNIMEDNVVIYRVGFTDSFDKLVLFGDGDKVVITKFEKVSFTGGTLVANIDYVCTVDVGVLKPLVYANNNLEGGKDNFTELAQSAVSSPVYHAEELTLTNADGTTDSYAGYYSITVTITGLTTADKYFYWIKFTGDAPDGDGSSLELPNGVVGGQSTEVTWGNKKLTFYKGMLLGVQDAN